MAQLALDTFTRANENPLTTANWTTITGSGNLQLVSNRAQPVSNSGTCGARWSPLVLGDQYSEVTIQAIQAGGGDCRIAARISAAAATYYFTQVLGVGAGQSVKLWKVVGFSTFTQIGTTQVVTVTAGDVFRCECQGVNIRAKQNGVSLITGTDSSIASGSPGFSLGANGTAALSNVSRWAAGNFGSQRTLVGVGA